MNPNLASLSIFHVPSRDSARVTTNISSSYWAFAMYPTAHARCGRTLEAKLFLDPRVTTSLAS